MAYMILSDKNVDIRMLRLGIRQCCIFSMLNTVRKINTILFAYVFICDMVPYEEFLKKKYSFIELISEYSHAGRMQG